MTARGKDETRLAAFKASRLTTTTFKIVEYDDVYDEHPFIYAKIYDDIVVLVDSGCGGATKNTHVAVRSLRAFIETAPVADNGDEPLNAGGKRSYGIVSTHCHYDHILAFEQFTDDSTIFASSHSPEFLAPENLPASTLCERLGIPTPKYVPKLVDHGDTFKVAGVDTKLVCLHTPGHTPDELAVWDEAEGMLYVGDTVYEWEAIIFPMQGDITQWFTSMDFLIDYVLERNYDLWKAKRPKAKINAGHCTSMVDALEVLKEGKQFLLDVVSGREPLQKRTTTGGVKVVQYAQKGGRFSLRCPEVLVDNARQKSP